MIWFIIPVVLTLAVLAALRAFPRLYFLKEDEQVLVESFTRRWTVDGPGVVVARPFQRVQRRKGTTLGPTEYLRIRDAVTGEMRNERGPKLYLPSATEEVVEHLSAIPLKRNQYVRLMDTHTGIIRVERGETSVYLEPTEKCLQNVQDGINIDEHTAVVVRDIESGQLALITVPHVFIPAAHQEVIAVRKPILLQDHETIVIRDRTGGYVLKQGSDAERSFFLDPYSELVELRWSTGLHKGQRTLKITHIDGRPKFMWYEFEARTQDNVELVLGITFFWQIVDVEAMVRATDDAPGDVCSHARSAIIQSTSQVTLEQFLSAFNDIVREAVLETDGAFYTERGIRLHAVEVRSLACKGPGTQHILQEIVRETIDRLDRLQKQESENEVKLGFSCGTIVLELDSRRDRSPEADSAVPITHEVNADEQLRSHPTQREQPGSFHHAGAVPGSRRMVPTADWGQVRIPHGLCGPERTIDVLCDHLYGL